MQADEMFQKEDALHITSLLGKRRSLEHIVQLHVNKDLTYDSNLIALINATRLHGERREISKHSQYFYEFFFTIIKLKAGNSMF
jgi:hypothetical protein